MSPLSYVSARDVCDFNATTDDDVNVCTHFSHTHVCRLYKCGSVVEIQVDVIKKCLM